MSKRPVDLPVMCIDEAMDTLEVLVFDDRLGGLDIMAIGVVRNEVERLRNRKCAHDLAKEYSERTSPH